MAHKLAPQALASGTNETMAAFLAAYQLFLTDVYRTVSYSLLYYKTTVLKNNLAVCYTRQFTFIFSSFFLRNSRLYKMNPFKVHHLICFETCIPL